MKILHLVPPGLGGVDAYVFSHYKYMDQGKFRFDFLTRNPDLKDAAQYTGFSYGVRRFPHTAAEDPGGFERQIRGILKDGYDVLHLHTSYWTGIMLEKIAKDVGIRKVIVHSHSTSVEESDVERRRYLFQRHEEIKRGLSVNLATDYWACSQKAADWLFGDRIPKEQIKIMKNAVELERYAFNLSTRIRIRRELGIEDSLVLGTVGRISYSKNHTFLVDVFAEFYKRHPNAKLLVIGDGDLREALEEQIRENRLEKAVLLLGWRTNIEDYLQSMDCFLLPSRFEGLGIAVIEAAVSGLSCIVSEQLPEEIEISEHIHKIPLECSLWVSEVEEIMETPIDRQCGVEVARNAGYDIKQQAKILERMYQT